MLYAYDLDGTLADTREAVLASYRAVGVEPPPDFFGKPWREWLQDKALHDAKNEVYKTLAPRLVRQTRLVDTYRRTGGFIITGASLVAARIILDALCIDARLYCELDMEQKARILTAMPTRGIVFEDSLKIALYLKENTEWTVCCVL